MNNTKRIFNEAKTVELHDCDSELGKLIEDKILVAHHVAVTEIAEQSHEVVITEYGNGGKDIAIVIDVPYQAPQEAWDEYEDIQIFVPYTQDEMNINRENKYKSRIVAKIRERYSLDDELSIHRQKDTKLDEWVEYSVYCEECKVRAKLN